VVDTHQSPAVLEVSNKKNHEVVFQSLITE